MAPRICIADPELKLYRYTAIDEYSCYRSLGASSEQSTYSSADFLRRMAAAFERKGAEIGCIQTDNGFEFTNRVSNSQRDIPTLVETAASKLGIRHKPIRPLTPRHNGKVAATPALYVLPGDPQDRRSRLSLYKMFDKPTVSHFFS